MMASKTSAVVKDSNVEGNVPPHCLLVPVIHPVNVIWWWVVSWWRPVVAGCVEGGCDRFVGSRLHRLDVDAVLSADIAHCFRAAVVTQWEAVVDAVRVRPWSVLYDGVEVDFTANACQELAKQFERWQLLVKAQAQLEGSRLIDSLIIRYLRRVNGQPRATTASGVALLSAINSWSDWVWSAICSLGRIIGAAGLVVGSALRRDRAGWKPLAPVRYLWDGVNPNEVAGSAQQRYFAWIVDGDQIRPDEVLFLFPDLSASQQRAVERSGYRVVGSVRQLYRAIPRRVLWSCAGDLARLLPRLIGRAVLSVEGLLQARYVSRIVTMTPLIRNVRPAGYVTSISAMGSESPVVAYLTARRVSTVMYCYSTNVALFGSTPCRCDFRNVTLTHIVAQHVIVWHADFQRFLASHPQDGATIHVMGALLPGDERVVRHERSALLDRYRLRAPRTISPLTWICVFDEAALAKSLQQRGGLYPMHYTEAYATAFLRDIVRLLEEQPDLALVFKPQRSLQKVKFVFSKEFRALVNHIQRHPRGLVLPDDVNPWLPMALADLCIGMPFTSPVQAGWQWGTPGFYHDPTGICVSHRYPAFQHLLTHDYEALSSLVRSLLSGAGEGPRAWERFRDQLTAFMGGQDGTSASDHFRMWLRQLSGEGMGPRAMLDDAPLMVETIP